MSFSQILRRERATRRHRILIIVITCSFTSYIIRGIIVPLNSIILKKEGVDGTYSWSENFTLMSKSANSSEVNAAFFLHLGCRFERGTQSAVIDIVKAMKKWKHFSGVEFFYTRSDGELDTLSRLLLSKSKFQEAKPSAFFMQMANEGLFVYEYPTLYNVWKYCTHHKERFVVYMHTLGSSKPWSLRRKLTRQVMQHQLLSTINRNSHLNTSASIYATCGERTRKKRNWHCGTNAVYNDCWSHYSGNFWIASCAHVNTLKRPVLSKKEFQAAMQEAKHGYGNSSKCVREDGPTGRYWAEAWIIHGKKEDTQDLPNPRKKLVNIGEIGDASFIAKLVQKSFFSYKINLVSFLDFLARIFGYNW